MRPLIYLVLIGVMATLIWLDDSPQERPQQPQASRATPPIGSELRARSITAMTSRDGALYLGDETGRIWVVPKATKAPQRYWFAHLGAVRQMHWVGETLVTVSADGTVAEWSEAGIPEKRSRLNDHHLNAAALLPGGGLIVAADRGTIARLDVGHRWRSPGIHAQSAFAIDADPTGALVVSAGADGMLRLWDAPTGEQGHRWKAHQTWVTKVIWTPAGIWSAGADGRLKRWSVAGKLEVDLDAGEKAITALMIQADTIITGSEIGEVRVFDTRSGKQLWQQTVQGTVMSLTGLAGAVYVGQADGVVSIWDMTNGRSRGTLRGDR